MTRPVDDNLLLALIEDELSPEEAARVRRELAEADPELASRIEQMSQQRALMRSDPEPAVPDDLLAAVEARLARSLLIDSNDDGVIGTVRAEPGAGARRIRHFALAAMLVLALLAGIWTAAVLMPDNGLTNRFAILDRQTTPEIAPVETMQIPLAPLEDAANEASAAGESGLSRDELADGDDQPAALRRSQRSEGGGFGGGLGLGLGRGLGGGAVDSIERSGDRGIGETDSLALDGVDRLAKLGEPLAPVSVAAEPAAERIAAGARAVTGVLEPDVAPLRARMGGIALERNGEVAAHVRQEHLGEQVPVAIEMLLLIRGTDQHAIERTLEAIVPALDRRGMIVRNFDYHEARQLERRWLQAQAEQPLPAASERLRMQITDGHAAHDLELLAFRAHEQLAQERGEGAEHDAATVGRHFAGALSARQLLLSRNGATHTITLPVDAVEPLLARLNVDEGFDTMLVPLEDVRSRLVPEPVVEEGDAASPQHDGVDAAEPAETAAESAAWFRHLPRHRELLIQLETMDPHTLLHLPARVVE